MTRFTKQLIFGSIYLLIFGSIGWGLYRVVVPAPSCTDGVQNGKEEGLDCGAAACSTLCAPAVKSLVVLPAQIVAYGSSSYDVLASLNNPNATYGARRVDYVLTVTDVAGKEVATRRGNTYVNALEKRQIVFTFVSASSKPASAVLQVSEAAVQWALLDLKDGGVIDFSVRRDQLTHNSGSLRYEGVAANNSKYDFDTVDVTVLLYDAGNTLVGTGTTVINTLLAGAERGFVVDWPFDIPSAIRAEAIITTNVFSNDNYIRAHGIQQRF